MRRPGPACGLNLAAALALVVPGMVLVVWWTPLVWRPHWPGLAVVLLTVLAAPVLEEIVFRGGLQEWLLARGWRAGAGLGLPSTANIAASLIFAACHLLHHPPLWAAAMYVPSLIFGALYERRRRLGAPIVAHSVYNAAYFLLLAPA